MQGAKQPRRLIPLLFLGLAALAWWGRRGRTLANGSVHRYLGYGFYTVVGALVVLAVTR